MIGGEEGRRGEDKTRQEMQKRKRKDNIKS
jgi:hypothetical protein